MRWTLWSGFAHFGCTPTRRNSWSARSDDRLALALWDDQIENGRINLFGKLHGIQKPGNLDRIQHLLWAQKHRDGCFWVVRLEAEDPAAYPYRKIKRVIGPDPRPMRLIQLCARTGEFIAETCSDRCAAVVRLIGPEPYNSDPTQVLQLLAAPQARSFF
jgi:hypothetical protein